MAVAGGGPRLGGDARWAYRRGLGRGALRRRTAAGQRWWGWNGAAVGNQHRASTDDREGPHWLGLGRGALRRRIPASQRWYGWDGVPVGCTQRAADSDSRG